MVHLEKQLILFLVFLACLACNNDRSLRTLDEIKRLGDINASKAIGMLDSIQPSLDRESRYVRMKGMLLRMRLKDKNYIKAQGNDSAKAVTEYFSDHGTDVERQEAYYYAGSAYRDLKDCPRALENFLKSSEIGEQSTECDSTILRDTYSNIAKLFSLVLDSRNSLKYALKEYRVSREIDKYDIKSILHIGESYLRLDSIEKANYYFCEAENACSSPSVMNIYSLLYDFSAIKNIDKANEIYAAIKRENMEPTISGLFALGKYYTFIEQEDSAMECYVRIIDHGADMTSSYNASRLLYDLSKHNGDLSGSMKYADKFIAFSDSLDFGKRQEAAATVNNQFLYYKNKKEELRMTAENEKFRTWILLITAVSILSGLSFSTYYLRKRNRYLSEILSLSHNMERIKAEKENMQEQIQTIENELSANKLLLAAKQEENKRIVALLHKSHLKENAADIIMTIKNSSVGKHTMTTEEWNKLYQSVDELRPDLMEKMIHYLGNFTEQQQQVCYLMTIGLTNTQIENLTNIPHVTVWRWVKKFDWVVADMTG